MHGGDPLLSGVRYIIAVFLLLQSEEEKDKEEKEEEEREKEGEKEKKVENERKKGKYRVNDKEEKGRNGIEKEVEEEKNAVILEGEKDSFDSYDNNEDLAVIRTFLSTYRDHRTVLSVGNDLNVAPSSLSSSHLSSEGDADALTETGSRTETGTRTGEGARVPLNGARVPLKDSIYNPTEKKNFSFGFGFEFLE